MLSLAGWHVEINESYVLKDEQERLEKMAHGHAELVAETTVDFGYDLAAWRELLLTFDEFGYQHPYAFNIVDDAVRAAIADPEFPRLAALAAIGGDKWVARYHAKREREREAYRAMVAAREARIVDGRCPLCSTPLISYRLSCKHCGEQVRLRH